MTKRERVAAEEREQKRRERAGGYFVKAAGVRELLKAWDSLSGAPQERLRTAADAMEAMASDLLAGRLQ
jgi:hypothetical protein